LIKGITIAGGGLAGLSLACGLRRRGIPVILHEAGRYPRHRVCGEFISGVKVSTLESLGIADDLAEARRHRSVKWFRDGGEILTTELPESAFGISRYRLDEAMKNRLLAAGGTVIEGSRVSREPREGVVVAAGRVPKPGPWIGLKCHLLDFEMLADLEMHLGTNGYAGLTPVEDGRVNLCGLFKVDRSLVGKGVDLLDSYLRRGGNGALVERIRSAVPEPASFLGVAGFELGWQGHDASLCSIGDAAGMIPPFTGNGMSMAFESAELALDPLTDWAHGRRSWSEVTARIHSAGRRKFRKRVANAMLLHEVLLHQRGQALISTIGKTGLLPFRPLLSLIR
jgi:flavin-dependent dehydrogenase